MSVGQFLQKLAPQLIERSSNCLTSSMISSSFPYIVFKIVVFRICILFVVLRDTDNYC